MTVVVSEVGFEHVIQRVWFRPAELSVGGVYDPTIDGDLRRQLVGARIGYT